MYIQSCRGKEEGEGGKGRREEKKRKKEEREREKRELAARFAAVVGHARAAASGRTVMHAEREEGDGTVIGTGVGTVDCWKMISGDWELNDGKDFEMKFLASDLFG